MHRYLAAIAAQPGRRVTEIVVNHRPRRFGRSKYGLSRTFGVLVDLVQLRGIIRQAVDPVAAVPAIYQIAEVLEGPMASPRRSST